MIPSVPQLIDTYWSWLRDKTVLREVNGHYEITTPYLDRHNDRLQIYAVQQESQFVLSDDGYIIRDLTASGCDLGSAKRRAILNTALNGFGVKLINDVITVRATKDDFAQKKHSLVQAMLAVNDMFYLASSTISNLFLEDVTNWLSANDIRFTSNVKFAGKSGYDQLFHFVIPASNKAPERIVHAMNRPSKQSAFNTAFSWLDTRELRAPNQIMYAVLNDDEHSASPAVAEALSNYGVVPVLWSHRDDFIPKLAA